METHIRCCSDKSHGPHGHKKAKKPKAIVIENSDVEKFAARDHIVVGVSGMTCTGCAKKMKNVLDKMPAISNGQVTFVSGLAEFDLDQRVASPEDTLRQIEKETDFKLSRIISGFQTMDVIMSHEDAQQLGSVLTHRVGSVEHLKKTTYRINYNPRVLGARSLLGPNMELAPPVNDTGKAESQKRLMDMLWKTVVAALFTIPVVVLNWSDAPIPDLTKSVVSLVLATVVQAIAIPEFYTGALKSLIYSRIVEMDMLVVISITAAYLYSIVAFAMTESGYELEQGEFFETSSLLITLVLLGRLMAAWARLRAVSLVSVRSLQVESALLVDESGNLSKIDVRLLEYGDEIHIPSHSRVVTDGDVLSGESVVDESMVTGESIPVPKQKGATVIAGTINGSGALRVHLTRLPGENSITDIAGLVENALAAKPRIQELADKVASWFIPAVVSIAIITLVIWIAVAMEVRNDNGGGAFGTAITYGIAVLAVSCPCALGLAVPMVLVIAGGVAARGGVIVKAADAIERGYKVTDVVFDKTGTLTKGDLKVVNEETLPGATSKFEALALASSLVEGNTHPVSLAVSSHLKNRSLHECKLDKTTSIPGSGIEASWKGKTVKAGNPYWLGLEQHPDIAALLNQGMTSFCVTVADHPVLAFGLKSTLRDEASTVIAELQRRNIACHIVSGDAPAVVADVARTLGIDPSQAVARHSPAQKQQYISNLQVLGKTALFCGDGTNDAVAVAQANVGAQIGSASDVTSAVADAVLLGGLEGIVSLLDTSRRAFRRIQFNFVWSAVYNFFAILLAAGAFVNVRIPPAYAGLGEIVSVGPVVLAAASLAIGGRKDGGE